MINLKKDYLSKQPNFVFKPRTIIFFIVAAIIASVLNIGNEITFHSQNPIPYFARTTISLIVLLAFVAVTIGLLKQNGLPSKILGLQLSGRSFLNTITGVVIGIVTIVLLMALLYAFVPYHFVAGSLNSVDVLKESYSYCLGNSLEEFLFRGFLLVILSQLMGWRTAVFIMALPFGLFHLYFMGPNITGLKMVITTAAFSFVFSYAYILTGSLWTAICTHVSSNILLHAVMGLDGANRAMFVPVFDAKWPVNYDLGMVVSLLVTAIVASFLYLLIKYRRAASSF
ncbi:type II CAAX endopeptidase family protein [Mucilaginibacter sp.]|uniref:CPBP family intramembrane glutamic endopeptidase n=1 Tax=Mucilaginibacter sp. TaxID=1882438 RepID=UPI002630E6F3|nr:type II CAAX endopeptidase family protein [Mucilaginibacter sp.]MDB5032364.1 family intrarane metalloprotease [Mucilaginibacter sp.]